MTVKNKYKKRERIAYIVMGAIILFLVSGFIYTTFYKGVYSKNAIIKDKVVVQGARIVKIDLAPKAYELYIVDFVFNYKGKEYKAEIKNGYKFRKISGITSKYFPVAFEKDNVENAFILIKPEDFEKFEVPFPDSLAWLNEELF